MRKEQGKYLHLNLILIFFLFRNGYSYSTTLLLSVFFGILGVDRLYLGHVGMGALKFCTLGFLFIGQLVDIILIATQNIQPKDGSNYVVGYYGPGVETIRSNNLTYIVPRNDWFT
jgi:TM2 domain-containing membrane protein YozV